MIVRRVGPFFIPKYQGNAFECWEDGCDFEASQLACRSDSGSYQGTWGQLATINTPFENSQVRNLLKVFGKFDPSPVEAKTFYWFYNALKENKINNWDSTYTWPEGNIANFTNW